MVKQKTCNIVTVSGKNNVNNRFDKNNLDKKPP